MEDKKEMNKENLFFVKMKKSIFFIAMLGLFIFGGKVNAASLSQSEADIYALNPTYQDKISIPTNIPQSFKIEVEGATETPTYSTTYYGYINISDDGVVTPALKTWYCLGSYRTTTVLDNYDYIYQDYSFEDGITIKVNVDGQTLVQTINLKNYADLYAQQIMKEYLDKNITDSMTEYEKMIKIADFVVSYPYSTTSTSYIGLILGEGGDCIACSSTVVYMCKQLGIEAHMRYAVNDSGAGNNHHNVAAILDGEMYVIETAYNSTDHPRNYNFFKTTNGLSLSGNKFYQYDGYDEILNIPESADIYSYVYLGSKFIYYGLHSSSKITTVNVPKTVTFIYPGAFSGVSTLTTVNIDSNNTEYKSIDNVVYKYDGSRIISYPAGKENSSYEILDGTTAISSYAFFNAGNLKYVTIPNSVTTIYEGAFENSELISATIPNSVETIETYAFYGSRKMQYISILNKDTSISSNAIPKYITIIGYENSTAEEYANTNGNNFITIESENSKEITNDMIYGLQDSVVYDGTNEQNITIKDGDYTLVEGRDYTITYSNNTKVTSLASYTIQGIGDYYGYFYSTYSITAKTIEYKIDSTTITYSKSGMNLNITTNIPDDVSSSVEYKNGNSNISLSSLTPGTYQINLIISATNYKTVNDPITVTVVTGDISLAKTSLDSGLEYYYTGSAIIPALYVYDGNYRLTKNTDYTVNYSNNIEPGTASVKIIGMGNYTGTITKTFTIKNVSSSTDATDTSSLKSISSLTITSIANQTYTGSAIKPSLTIKNGSIILKSGTDYTISYSNNKNTGKATVKISGKGDYTGTITKYFYIVPKKVTGVKASSQTTSSITLKWTKATGASGYAVQKYNSSTKKWVTVKNVDTNSLKVTGLSSGTTYKFRVRAYKTVSSSKKYGSYSSTLTTTTKTKTPKISKITAGSKKATVKWSKVSGATGYEVYMSTSKSKGYSKVKTITKSSTVSYKKTGLKKGKTYYFKIRTYRTVSGKKIYSNYSTVKKVKVK